MTKLSTQLGASVEQEYKLDGTNYIDIFPIKVNDSGRPTSPTFGNFTAAGKTMRAEFWSEGDLNGYEYEINHQYLENGNCELHCRVFPENDTAGSFEIQYDFVINSIGENGVITIRSGGLAVMTGTFNAGDNTASKGVYASAILDGSTLDLKQGEMLQGNIIRNSSTYNGDIIVSEIGLHIPVGATGEKLI